MKRLTAFVLAMVMILGCAPVTPIHAHAAEEETVSQVETVSQAAPAEETEAPAEETPAATEAVAQTQETVAEETETVPEATEAPEKEFQKMEEEQTYEEKTQVVSEECSGHVWQDATCVAPKICSVCNASEGSFDAENHTGGTAILNDRPSTCLVEGYTGDVYCADCFTLQENGKNIPVLTHSFENEVCTKCGLIEGMEVVANSGKVTVTGYNYSGNRTVLEIPEEIAGLPVTAIGDGAFRNDRILESITLPGTLTSIGSEAFAECIRLTEINVPGSVHTVSQGAFYGCESLAKVTLGSGVTTVGDSAFADCVNLKSITLPTSVNTIGEWAFANTGLESLHLSSNVGSIGLGAFSGCAAMTEMTLPFAGAYRDSAYLFGYIFGDVSYTGGTATVQAGTTFYIPTALKKVTILGGSIRESVFENCSTLTDIVLPGTATSVGNYAFRNCSALTSLVIPDSVTYIGADILTGCISLKELTIPFLGSQRSEELDPMYEEVHPFGYLFGTKAYTGAAASKQQVRVPPAIYETRTYYIPRSLTTLTINNGELYYGSLNNFTRLSVLNLGSGVTYIHDGVFTGCNSFEEVNIAEGMTRLGYNAFYDCEWLLRVSLPESLESIGSNAFYNCIRLPELKLPSKLKTIEWNAFSYCEALESMVIPNSVKRIDNSVFSYCKSLKSVKMPDAVDYLGEWIFGNCIALTSVELPKNITNLPACTFIYCYALQSIDIPATVRSISESAFDSCTSLESVVIPEGVEILERGVFKGCSKLKDVTIPDTVLEMRDRVFSCCYSLEYIELPEFLYTMGEGVFECTGLREIVIPQDLVEIPASAFESCSQLSRVTLSPDTTMIGARAFAGCQNLRYIFLPATVSEIGDNVFGWGMNNGQDMWHILYGGTEAQWNRINLGTQQNFDQITFHYNATGDEIQGVINGCIKELTCTICNKTLGVKLGYNHDYTNAAWVVSTSAGCNWGGSEYRKCNRCNEQEWRYTESLGHTGGEASCKRGAICTRCWCEYGDFDPNVHINTNVTGYIMADCETDGYTGDGVCLDCGTTIVGKVVPALGGKHVLSDWKESYVTTCTEDGWECRTCDNCMYYEEREKKALGHDWGEWQIKAEPNCVFEGGEERYCNRCGEYESRVFGTTLGHDFAEWYMGPGYTCEMGGEEYSYCKRCGVCEYRNVAPAEHEYSSWTPYMEATCTESATEYRTCNKCGSWDSRFIGEPLGHVFGEWYEKSMPVCEYWGYKERYCQNCNYVEGVNIEPLGHDWGEWQTKSAPTCTYGGDEERYCSRCYAWESRTMGEPLDHDWGEWQTKSAPTCSYGGDEERYCSRCYTWEYRTMGEPLGHDWGEWFWPTPNNHSTGGMQYSHCNYCGQEQSRYVEATDHEFGEWYISVEPSCTGGGTKYSSCNLCGYTEYLVAGEPLGHTGGEAYCKRGAICERCGVEYTEIDYNNHIGGTIADGASNATCTQPGYTGDIRCVDCWAILEKGQGIEALGHDWGQWQEMGLPACEIYGYKDRYCNRCNEKETVMTEPLGHDYESVVTEPGCTGSGFTTYTCKRCQHSYVDNYTWGMGHDYQAVVTDATCLDAGYTTNTCARCGDSYVDNEMPALGHSWDEGVVTLEPTEEAAGVLTYTCQLCEMTREEEIPQLVHTHKHEAVIQEPTCTEAGFTTFTCPCGDSYVADAVDALGHAYEAVVIEPTYINSGYTVNTCANCGDSYVEGQIPALGLPTPDVYGENDVTTGDPILHWDAVEEASGYEIFRSNSQSKDYASLGIVAATEYQDDTAAAGKTYYYKVKAVCETDDTLNSKQSDSVSIKSLYPQPEVTVANNASGYPVVKWEKVSEASKYEVWCAELRDGDEELKFTKLTATSSTSYTYSKAKLNVEYCFQVRAYGSSSSYAGAFSEPVEGFRKLAVPTVTVSADHEASSVKLSWKKISGADGYELQCSINGGEFETIEVLTEKDTGYTHENLAVGVVYAYRLSALCDNDGASSDFSDRKEVVVQCAKPVLVVGNEENGKPSLSWEPVKGAAAYEIQMATSAKGKFITLAVTEDTYFVHEDAVGGATYYYQVCAMDANGVAGSYCAKKSVVCDCDAPVVTEVSHNASGYPVIKWNKVTGAKKYEVWYKTDADDGYKKLATVSATSYTYSKAKMDVEYSFQVRAYGSATTSTGPFSEPVWALRKLKTPTVTLTAKQEEQAIGVKWSKIEGAVGYELQCSINGGEFRTVEVLTEKETNYIHEDLEVGVSYTYRLVAVYDNEEASSDFSAQKTASIRCAKPAVEVDNDELGKPVLSWEPVKGAVTYEIQMATSAKGKFKTLTVTEDTQYIHEDAVGGTTYYYQVRAVDGNGIAGDFCAKKSAVCLCDAPVITEAGNNAAGYPVIKWNKVTGAKKYEVWYKTDADTDYKKLATVSATSYTYSKAKLDVEYFFQIRAYGSSTASLSPFSESVWSMRKLKQPSISLSTNQKTQTVTVKWSKITGAVAYELQCSMDGGEFETIEVLEKDTKFVHQELAPGHKYSYRLRVIGSRQEIDSDYCAEKSSVIKVGKPALAISLEEESGKPCLTWDEVEGAVQYQIYYATSKSGTYKLLESTEELSFVYEEAPAKKSCYFKVRAVDINGTAGDYSSVKNIKSK